MSDAIDILSVKYIWDTSSNETFHYANAQSLQDGDVVIVDGATYVSSKADNLHCKQCSQYLRFVCSSTAILSKPFHCGVFFLRKKI